MDAEGHMFLQSGESRDNLGIVRCVKCRLMLKNGNKDGRSFKRGDREEMKSFKKTIFIDDSLMILISSDSLRSSDLHRPMT